MSEHALSAGLVLASGSPRRRELLAQLGVPVQVCPADIDESPRDGEAPADYVLRMAREKAQAGLRRTPGTVLGADTAVVLDGEILGKPSGRAAALRMLAVLSERTHEVFSAVAVTDGDVMRDVVSTTRVTFGAVSPEAAAAYWATGEPEDKAGAYGIQGLGAMFVRHIDGSYSGVVGLPLYETAGLLARFGVRCGLDLSAL